MSKINNMTPQSEAKRKLEEVFCKFGIHNYECGWYSDRDHIEFYCTRCDKRVKKDLES